MVKRAGAPVRLLINRYRRFGQDMQWRYRSRRRRPKHHVETAVSVGDEFVEENASIARQERRDASVSSIPTGRCAGVRHRCRRASKRSMPDARSSANQARGKSVHSDPPARSAADTERSIQQPSGAMRL